MTSEAKLDPTLEVGLRVHFAQATIVVANSDPKGAALLKSALSSLGCRRIMLVRDGQEVLQLLDREKVDILVIEWELKSIKGIDVVRDIRSSAQRALCDLPVVMLSDCVEREAVEAARDAGVNEYLVKPFTTAALLMCVYSSALTPRPSIVSNEYIGPDRRLTSSFTELLPAEDGGEEDGQPAAGAAPLGEERRVELVPFSRDERLEEMAVCMRSIVASPQGYQRWLNRIATVAKAMETEASEQGLARTSQVARMLQEFCVNHFVLVSGPSIVLLERHVLTLRALLEGGMEAENGPLGETLVTSLQERSRHVINSGDKHKTPL